MLFECEILYGFFYGWKKKQRKKERFWVAVDRETGLRRNNGKRHDPPRNKNVASTFMCIGNVNEENQYN